MTEFLEIKVDRVEELKKFFWEIQHKLTDIEVRRMELELEIIEHNISEVEHHKILELLIKELKVKKIEPLNYDVIELLNRSYELSGFGCKNSCLSSANIVLEIENFLAKENGGTISYEFISIKGHMAPFIYANEYVKANFSLLYLYAMHYSDIISPVLKEKITKKCVNVYYNLGYGLGKVLSLMMKNPTKKYIVLMGDSDLSFGATLEALMYIKTQNYNNLTLIIDFNKYGFEARPDGFDTTILESFFDTTLEIDNIDLENNRAFSNLLVSSQRGAIFINTKKENHRVTLFLSEDERDKSSIKLTLSYGKNIAKLNRKYQKELLIFTPDLASRFALKENGLTYVNTTVSEVLTPLLAIKQNQFSAIATDQKYATNMIGSLLELYKETGKVLLTLAKSWDYWGGEANALNLLNTLPQVTVYEICCESELTQLLEAHYHYPSYKTIVSICDMELPRLDFKPKLKEANYLIENGTKSVVISFGIATALIYDVAKEEQIDLIHFAKMRLSYDARVQAKLDRYEHVYLMEYNGKRHGFSEHFLSLYHLSSYTIKTSKETIPQMKALEQIEYHGFSKKAIKRLFRNNNIF